MTCSTNITIGQNIFYNHLFPLNGVLRNNAWRHSGTKWASAITCTFTFFIFIIIIAIIITIIAIIAIITAFLFARLAYTCDHASVTIALPVSAFRAATRAIADAAKAIIAFALIIIIIIVVVIVINLFIIIPLIIIIVIDH